LHPGDSHFFCLSDKEIADLAKFIVKESAGRAMVIAADFQYPTKKAVAFAEYLKEVGADLYMVYPPNWANAMTPETCSDHYAAVAEIMPVMLLFSPFAGDGDRFKLIDLIFEKTKGVVALKDDVCGPVSRKLGLRYHDRLAMISGGQKQNHLNQWPYGCDGYLSTYASFKPEIAWKYWNAIQDNDIKTAAGVIEKYDMPYFDMILKFTGWFDAGIHATMELFGLSERWRRPPYYSTEEKEMEELRAFFKSLNLL